ncbi:MAG: cellulase [Verrucomicrobia bacterium]|nr:cellulase [Verrucomicrobiota bacterium]
MSLCGKPYLLKLGLVLLLASSVLAADENYLWRNVVIGGGGFVTGVEFHPTERGLAYARTDVGGAYRWDEATSRWTPLLDWLGQADWNLQGVESVALDPTDPNRVYLACGTYTQHKPEIGNGAILRSTDRGTTWARTALPFKLGANEAGRGSGERLMVDPNQPSHLYFGTRRDGLWQSADYGKSWTRVTSFPEVPDESVKHHQIPGGPFNYLAQPVGIAWVRFDKSCGKPATATPVAYAAVSRTGESIFRTTDSGKTWAPLPNQPTTFRPTGAALAPDGTLYITYGDEPGPSRMHNGAVYKYEPTRGTWTELTPEKPKPTSIDSGFGYAGVCVDPVDAKTLLVSTWGRKTPYDEIFRSPDGGKSWQPLLATATWDHSSAPYTESMTHHWLSDLEIDPFNRDRIVFNTGYGLWASTNATAAGPVQPAHWVFFNAGLEETVPLALISPPIGAHLISGVGDIDGFVHDDFAVSPRKGRFSAPGYKNTEWLDYAALKPATIVRSGTTYQDDRILAAVSDDGGNSWTPLASQPPHTGNSHRFTAGPVAISSDGKTITWTPTGSAPFLTTDQGRTWQPTLLPTNMRLVGDRVEPKTFYGYDAKAGALYVSTNSGASFRKTQSSLAVPPRHRDTQDIGDLAAVPGYAGETWLAAGGQLYHFKKHGLEMTAFPLLSEVGAVGFGKSSPNSEYPAVFITATIKGTHGLYRSDNIGATWVKLTDASHQFGSASRLTGDPRVFGRVYFCTGGRGIVYGERVPETGSTGERPVH